MYAVLIVLALAAALVLVHFGRQTQRIWPVALGVALAVLTILFFGFLGFWGEALWFAGVGYSERFWTVVLTQATVALVSAGLATGFVHVLTWGVNKERKLLRIGSKVIAAYIGGSRGLAHWDTVLLYLNGVRTATEDPILGKDTGFYLFVLPFYDALYTLLALLAIVALVTWGIGMFLRVTEKGLQLRVPEESGANTRQSSWSLYGSAAFLLVILAWGKYLDRFHLMYSTLGVVAGPGWTDAHIRLPAYGILGVLLLLLAASLIIPALRRVSGRVAGRLGLGTRVARLSPLIACGAVLAVAWLGLLAVIPGLFQWLYVQPNEITVERPYISHNIEFTRRAFKLDTIEEREFPVSEQFDRQMIQTNQGTFDNVRLWDWRALDSVYKQFQEIRLYYEFQDVDVDRYTFADNYREVMVSAREMNLNNLPTQSQTFVNKRFKYTHGYGVTLTTVSEFTPQGLPDLLVKDLPPQAKYPELEVARPEIYYGELTDTHVIVDTQEEEFDYPSGEQNVYTRYQGDGGVRLHNLWRKFLFGWKFDGTRLFLSSYPNDKSQILFHRRIQDRVKLIAPFLQFDDDPYVVLANGELYWIIDGYTTSHNYPYSEPFYTGIASKYRSRRRLLGGGRRLRGINYIRNSVKTVVDAYNGSVDFYVFDPNDPLIQAWQKIFPGLFKDRSEMPLALQQHVRYPADMLLAQGLVYAKYHMTDPAVFYNQEDLWVRATEKYYGQVQPVAPYYIMWEPPETDNLEFVLMQPFSPKNRQVLIGWIAAMCDGANYGRMLAYKFPKEERALGTQQMETKIDQDSYLSGQLSLWDQRGSRVIRGNVLVIPLEETLIYVEPIYLQAETAAYPELRLVAVMHNDQLSYAPTFDEALEGLYREAAARAISPDAPAEASFRQLADQASQAFDRYLSALGEKDFTQAGVELEKLQSTLNRLTEQAPATPSETDDTP
jgi:uncharacterized membrane protein (UPF0182 family)